MNHQEHHHFVLSRFMTSKMDSLYIFQALSAFVKSSIGIFAPLYLYSVGYSLIDILIYTIGISIIYLIMIPNTIKLIKQIGFKFSILISVPVYVTFITLLNYTTTSNLAFHLAWFFAGFYMAIFWPAFHSEIAMKGSTNHRAHEIGTMQILMILFSAAAPFFAGLVLEVYSYTVLLVVCLFILLFGFIPLGFSKDIRLKNYDFNYIDYYNFLIKNKDHNSKKAFGAEGVNAVLSFTIWPMILFILFNGDFLKIGIIFTLASILSVMFLLYLRKITDNGNKHRILKTSVKFLCAHWFLRSIVIFLGSFFIYFVEFFSKLLDNFFSMPYMSIFYNNAKKIGYMNYIILRELYLHGMKIIFSIVIIFLLMIYGENLILLGTFVLVGSAVAYSMSYLKEE